MEPLFEQAVNHFYPSHFFDLQGFEHNSLFTEEPVWKALAKLKTYLIKQRLGIIEGKVSVSAYLINPESISIGKGSIVEPGAYIQGPCVIGRDCQIRHGAYIRENVITGNHCVIGHATEVKNAIFLNGAKAGHFAYVGDSILGNGVNLGAGTKCANLRLDSRSVQIRTAEGVIDTELRKLGAIFGDDSQTGCNSVTNPGTIMGKKSCCYPCVTLSGLIGENVVIRKKGNE